MKVTVLLLLALVVIASSQQVQNIFNIDDFSASQAALFVVNSGSPGTSQSQVNDNSIIGGQRDLSITSLTGQGTLITTGVIHGLYSSSAPTGGTGSSLCQYDGIDADITLNPSGLDGYDFTVNSAYAFLTNVSSDLDTTVTFSVFSGSSDSYCEFVLDIIGDQGVSKIYLIPYSSFQSINSGCQFTNVGAFEIETLLPDSVDISVDTIQVVAKIGPTPTATASSSRVPSASVAGSRTPTPSKSISSNPRSASVTPTASGCTCTCPELECFMFKYGEYALTGTLHNNIGKREIEVAEEVVVEEDGFDFLKFF